MANIERFTREAMRPLLEPYGLCEAVKAGNLLTLGGQTGLDAATHAVVEGGLQAQATQAFANIREVLAVAGATPDNLVHLTWYLVEEADGRAFLEDALIVTAAREAVMPGVIAASTAVRVKALLTPEILIEIQATAAL